MAAGAAVAAGGRFCPLPPLACLAQKRKQPDTKSAMDTFMDGVKKKVVRQVEEAAMRAMTDAVKDIQARLKDVVAQTVAQTMDEMF